MKAMKPETYVGIGLLLLFFGLSLASVELFRTVVFYFGCFAVGWNIPNASKFIVNFVQKRGA